MKKRHEPIIAILTSLLVVFLLACSGRSADISGTGIKSALIQGEIQSAGSIVVNGTQYLTDEATEISIDGEPGDSNGLQAGMVVELKVAEADLGRDGARAQSVAFRAAAQGPIEVIDQAAGQLEVLGRLILVDDLTRIFDASGQRLSFNDLQVGDTLRVSGHALDDATLQATLLARRGDATQTQLAHGVVRDLDPAARQFRLGTALVDFSQIDGPPPAEGDRVRVRGLRGERDRIEAQSLEILPDEPRLSTDRPGSLHGVLGAVEAGSQCPGLRLRLGDNRVLLNASTRFETLACAELAIGQRLTVSGRFDAGGALLADRLRATLPPNASLRAAIEDIAPGASNRRCSLTVLGALKLEVAADTRLDGSDQAADTAQRNPGCTDLRIGTPVQVVGRFSSAPGEPPLLTAARLGIAPEAAPQALAGVVQAVDTDNRQFTLLSTVVQITERTEFGSSDEAAFFRQLSPGDAVLVTGDWDGAALQAATAQRRSARSVDGPTTRPTDSSRPSPG